MKFLTALALLATTALAGGWNEGDDYYGNSVEMKPSPDTSTSTTMMNEMAPTTTMVMSTSCPSPTSTMMHDPPPPAQTSQYQLDTQPPPSPNTPMTHTVLVGGDAGLVFTPPQLMANIGDIIHFEFHKQNHSVTQSSFDKPCNKLAAGMDSGLMPNPNNTVVPAPVWEYTVTDMKPTCKPPPRKPLP